MGGTSKGILIGLSAGGSPEELAAQGLRIEDIEALMVRMATRLLRDGHQLAFGGTLGDPGKQLTQNLIDAARKWMDGESTKVSKASEPESWPLVNYGPWPNYARITQDQRASLAGVCRFIDIDPNGVAKSELDDVAAEWIKHPQARLFAADALTVMRDRSSQEIDLRIVWAGKIAKALGWMAGILEEVAFSLAHGKPILILGGFGGCSRLLAEYLADPGARWPEQLSLEACADTERDELLMDAARKRLNERFEQAHAIIAEFRSRLHSNKNVDGLPSQLVRDALLDQNSQAAVDRAGTAAQFVESA